MACGFVQCGCRTTASQGFGLRSNSGSLAKFAAIRRASPLVSSFAAARRPDSSSKQTQASA
jgi:hypothetical protein